MAGRSTAHDEPATRLLGVAGTLARNGVKGGEMGVAAAQTIGYRTAMMAAALGNPIKMANPEFVRMGAEKVEAGVEAVQELAEGFADLQRAWLSMFTGQVQLAFSFLGGLGAVRSPGDAVGLFEDSVAAGISAQLHFAEAAASFTGSGLGPLHRKTRANARRLGRKAWWL